ncbi:MAG: site-specific integrase [Rhodocyclales bacterium GT-UBC]|nr:MAG: site-specific integrase [Rhodocyclales bacterium GT-UBC]
MAKAYQEGRGWSIRGQYKGQEIYKSGFASARKAEDYLREQQCLLDQGGKPARQGPERTALCVALSDYARECLPYRKGARQDAQRLNHYLRAANLPIIKLLPFAGDSAGGEGTPPVKPRIRHWTVTLVDEPVREIPDSLRAHRAEQAKRAEPVQQARARLACMKVGDIQTYHLNTLINVMKDAGLSAASIGLERAELRRFFSHAQKVWHWGAHRVNPASKVSVPKIDNVRTRILTSSEFDRVVQQLSQYDNLYVLPLVLFMLETATRSSEPIEHAHWSDVDWDRKILRLQDAKAGGREVPLSNVALDILRDLREALQQRAQTVTRREHREKWLAAAQGGPIFRTSYNALKKAWSVACKAAGVDDSKPHDLRRTSATRYALQFNGDIFVVKTITGHKTDKMAARYVQISAEIVARLMDNESLPEDMAPARVKRHSGPPAALPENVLSLAQYRRSA